MWQTRSITCAIPVLRNYGKWKCVVPWNKFTQTIRVRGKITFFWRSISYLGITIKVLPVSRNAAWVLNEAVFKVVYLFSTHRSDVIMSAIASQITGVSNVYSTVSSGADQRKYQSSASLAFVRWIHRRSVHSPHKGTITLKMFPFDDVIMI